MLTRLFSRRFWLGILLMLGAGWGMLTDDSLGSEVQAGSAIWVLKFAAFFLPFYLGLQSIRTAFSPPPAAPATAPPAAPASAPSAAQAATSRGTKDETEAMTGTNWIDSEVLLKPSSIAKIGPAFVGLLYCLGYIVIAGHLAKYALSPFSLISLQYLAAGTWAFLPLFFVFAMFSLVVVLTNSMAREKLPDALEAGLLAIFVLISGLSVIGSLYILGGDSARHGLWNVIKAGFRQAVLTREPFGSLVLVVVLCTFIFALTVGWTDMTKDGRARIPIRQAPGLMTFVMATASSLILYAVGFGYYIFGHIPRSAGGGAPSVVVVVFKPEANSPGKKADAYLISESDKILAVTCGQEGANTILINRDELRQVMIARSQEKPSNCGGLER